MGHGPSVSLVVHGYFSGCVGAERLGHLGSQALLCQVPLAAQRSYVERRFQLAYQDERSYRMSLPWHPSQPLGPVGGHIRWI